LALGAKKKDINTDEKNFASLEFDFSSSFLLEYAKIEASKLVTRSQLRLIQQWFTSKRLVSDKNSIIFIIFIYFSCF